MTDCGRCSLQPATRTTAGRPRAARCAPSTSSAPSRGSQTARVGCSSSVRPGRPPPAGRCPGARCPASRASGWACRARQPAPGPAHRPAHLGGRPGTPRSAPPSRASPDPPCRHARWPGVAPRARQHRADRRRRRAHPTRARTQRGRPSRTTGPEGDPDELGDAALVTSQAGQEAGLRSFVAQFAPAPILDREADRLSAITASLAQAVPDSPVTGFAIAAHHRVFDAAAAIRPLPGGRPDLDLQRVVLRHARALGAALVRLELWPLVRTLIDHDAPDPAIYPGWMTHVGVQQARALGRPHNAETLRHPVREAVSTAQRVGALRPDGRRRAPGSRLRAGVRPADEPRRARSIRSGRWPHRAVPGLRGLRTRS